jgi:hypothetical protein
MYYEYFYFRERAVSVGSSISLDVSFGIFPQVSSSALAISKSRMISAISGFILNLDPQEGWNCCRKQKIGAKVGLIKIKRKEWSSKGFAIKNQLFLTMISRKNAYHDRVIITQVIIQGTYLRQKNLVGFGVH